MFNESEASYLDDTLVGLAEPSTQSAYSRGGKRLFDLALVLFTAPMWVPILLVVVALVALSGGKPVYTQKRVGRGGQEFTIYKVRTMVTDAKERLDAYLASNPEAAREWSTHQKLRNDPRITAVGRFLRKSSLDELPQIINVLKGDMSIVGPRPMMTDQRRLYPGNDYYSMRPGITCLWQISERSNSTFAARGSYDSQYYSAMSLRTDMRIILSTFRVVLDGTGC